MLNGMSEKIKQLNQYINRLEKIISDKDTVGAKKLQTEIICVFGKEIPDIRSELDNYNMSGLYSDKTVDFLGDANLLRAKLENYKINLSSNLIKPFDNGGNAVNITQTVQQDMQNNISISFEQTISKITELPHDVISDEDKEALCGKLMIFNAETTKEARWEKAKNVLKWIAEKGIEVGTAALPYIVQALQNN